MPWTEVRFYLDFGDRAPVVDGLEGLRRSDRAGFAKCAAAIRHLIAEGHRLRRPAAAHLGGGLYELRVRRGRVHYRILYFFHGRNVAVLVHALTKEGRIPAVDLERARERRENFEAYEPGHTYWREVE